MKVGIVRIGQVDSYVVDRIQENLNTTLPDAACELTSKALPIPEEAYDKTRQQYCSDAVLNILRLYAVKKRDLDYLLGIMDVDIFVPELNFIFGEAECPGKAALISLCRLKPEFYDRSPNMELVVERATKEAVHELGHALGLKHCPNLFCVMYFSNSIFETDRKQSLFCNKCYLKVEAISNRLGDEI
jgi:archaemetzincin